MGNISRLSRGVVVMLCLAVGARADDATTSFKSQADGAFALLQLESPHLSDSDKSSFAQRVADLRARATQLDEFQTKQIDPANQALSDAQRELTTANSAATALRQQADQVNQDGQARATQLAQSVNGICTQMGGSVSGEECVFTCPQDQQAICSQKVAAFNNQIAQLKAQIDSIAQGVQDAEQKAQVAEADASQKQQAVQQAQAAVDDATRDLAKRSSDFTTDLQTFSDDLKKAEKPINIPMGPAYHELVATNQNMHELADAVKSHLVSANQTCYDTSTKCFDMGANSDGTLVVPSVPVASTSAPNEKVSQLQTELQNLTNQYNDIHDKLRQAEANHDPHSGDFIRRLSAIQGKVEMTAYEIKTRSYRVDMSQVAVPAH